MLSLHTLYIVKNGMISCCSNHSDSTPPIRSPTHEFVVIIFIEIVLDEDQKGVGIVWQAINSGVKKVIEVELMGICTLWSGTCAD